LIAFFRDWWYARCRKQDLDLLWPLCKEKANGDLAVAKKAFGYHAYLDHAWLCLGREHIHRIIDSLE
jgi:hypothetical protein